jgi:hypothetical protein
MIRVAQILAAVLLVVVTVCLTLAITADNRPDCNTVPAGYPYPCK